MAYGLLIKQNITNRELSSSQRIAPRYGRRLNWIDCKPNISWHEAIGQRADGMGRGGTQERVAKASTLPWTGMNGQMKRVGTKRNLKVLGLRSPTIRTRKAARGTMAEDFPKWQSPKMASQCRHFRRQASRLIYYFKPLFFIKK